MQTARKFAKKAEDKKPFDPLLSHFLAGLEMKDYFFFQLPYKSSPFSRYPCPDIPFDPPKMNVDTPDFEKYFYDLVSAVNATFDTEQVLSFLESIHKNAKQHSPVSMYSQESIIKYLDYQNLLSLSSAKAQKQFTRIAKYFFTAYQVKEDAHALEQWRDKAQFKGNQYQFRKMHGAYEFVIKLGSEYFQKQAAETPKKAIIFIDTFFKDNDYDFAIGHSSGGYYHQMSRDFINKIEHDFISLIPKAIQSHNKQIGAFDFISLITEKVYDKNFGIVSTTHAAMNEHADSLPVLTRIEIDNLLLKIGITSETVEADNDRGYEEIDTSHRDIDAIFQRFQRNISQLDPSVLKTIELCHNAKKRLSEHAQKPKQETTFDNFEKNFKDIASSPNTPLRTKLDAIEKCVEQYGLEKALNIMIPCMNESNLDKSLKEEIFGLFTSSRKEISDQAFYKLADKIHNYSRDQDMIKSAKTFFERTLKRIHEDAVTNSASNGDDFSQRLSALTQKKKQVRQPKRP